MSSTYRGSGNALIVSSKCNKFVPFTSTYIFDYGGDGSDQNFSKVIYNNSIIGSRTLSAVRSPSYVSNSFFQEIASDGLLNFINLFFYDDFTQQFFTIITITGVYKKCNYSSIELDYLINSNSLSASNINAIKNKAGSSEEFHKILDSDQNLKKKYVEIKAKLGK